MFSPDGRVLATGSDDGTARLWDVATGQQLTQLTHDHQVFGVAFSPDGRLLATVSVEGTAGMVVISDRGIGVSRYVPRAAVVYVT